MAQLTRAARRAMQAEQLGERIAPAAQRKAVIVYLAGQKIDMLRGPRIERAGKGFVRSNPVRNLWSRSRARARAERGPVMVTDLHLACSERLLTAWTETCDGINLPTSYSPDRVGTGQDGGTAGQPDHGFIWNQIHEMQEWIAARKFLGDQLWGAILNVVLLGKDVKSWADSRDWDEKIAMGYLIAGLDRLVDFYEAITPTSRASSRAATVVAGPSPLQPPPSTTA